jgi:hypothetical protein
LAPPGHGTVDHTRHGRSHPPWTKWPNARRSCSRCPTNVSLSTVEFSHSRNRHYTVVDVHRFQNTGGGGAELILCIVGDLRLDHSSRESVPISASKMREAILNSTQDASLNLETSHLIASSLCVTTLTNRLVSTQSVLPVFCWCGARHHFGRLHALEGECGQAFRRD